MDIAGNGGGRVRGGTGVLIEVFATRGVNEVPCPAGSVCGELVVGVELLVELDESENASVSWFLNGLFGTAVEASTVGATGSSSAL